MKSSYDLAMERLSKQSPTTKLTPTQRKELAELDSVYAAKLAERDLFLQDQLGKALGGADIESMQQIQKQIASERRTLQSELEEKKQAVRERKS